MNRLGKQSCAILIVVIYKSKSCSWSCFINARTSFLAHASVVSYSSTIACTKASSVQSSCMCFHKNTPVSFKLIIPWNRTASSPTGSNTVSPAISRMMISFVIFIAPPSFNTAVLSLFRLKIEPKILF